MSPKKPLVLRCPTCKTIVTAADEDFPFCSDRCRKIDLGKWASGAYRISSPILDPDVLEDLESGRRPPSETATREKHSLDLEARLVRQEFSRRISPS
jgi:endogenous inhibitor of DNA gyrase (YacG/DUF329 family)